MAGFPSQSGGNLEQLVTIVNTEYNQALPQTDPIWKKFSKEDNRIGELITMPVHLSTQTASRKEWGEERARNKPYIVKLSSKVTRYEIPIETFPMSPSLDPYNIYINNPAEHISRMMMFWDNLMAETINKNPVTYDGQQMFSTQHIISMSRTVTGTFTNDITADLTYPGITKALKTLQSMKAEDGRLLTANIGVPYILVPDADMEARARAVVAGDLIPQVIGNGAASMTTPLRGRAEVVVFPQLADYESLNPNAGKQWYLVRRSDFQRAASFITRITQQPTLRYFGMDSWLYGQYKECGFVIEAEGGIDPMWPQNIVRCTLP